MASEAQDDGPARKTAARLAAVLLVLTALQISFLFRLRHTLEDSALMGSLSWNEALGVSSDVMFHELHLVGSGLGLCALALLYVSRSSGEKTALLLAAVPIAVSTASWGSWAIGHSIDVVGHYGFGFLIGMLGVLCGLLCPFAALFVLARNWREATPRSRPFLVMLPLAILAWTILTIARTIPYLAAA